ncbi:hypothetical protein ABEF95_012216 [Exophiala dermatitidis]
MTSILRLSKDRPTFLFRRQNQDTHVDTSSTTLDHRLPDISPVDTRSFADLFDQFKGREQDGDDSLDQRPSSPKEPLKAEAGRANLNINRNDSTTSSCYSQPSQRESECSPFVTRHSSSTSYTQDDPFAVSRTPSAKTAIKGAATAATRPVVANLGKSGTGGHGSRSTTNSSSLNLDKPLPPGPSEGAVASKSAPDLRLPQHVAELPSEPALPTKFPSAPDAVQSTSSGMGRMASTRTTSGDEALAQLQSWSTRPAWGSQSGKGVSQSHRRHRSASETAVRQGESLRKEQARRSSVDTASLMSRAKRPSRSKTHLGHHYKPITAATAERVIYKIMCNLHSIRDLESTAMVSKGFLRTFQRNQSSIVSHLIFKISKPAWERRRHALALKGSKSFLLKEYQRDCNIINALKAYIVAHCSPICRPGTLAGLLDQDDRRKEEVDNALWRVWTFCTLFGNTGGQDTVSQMEIDWLNGSKSINNEHLGPGFSVGNGQGLEIQELEDMIEMWQCLRQLVSGFGGREEEAKQYGVFDNLDCHLRDPTSERQHLSEWISYLLALGPQTVLSVSSCSFERAKMLGLTNWPTPTAGKSRSSFLVRAITQVYQERVLEEATLNAARFPLPARSAHRPSLSSDERRRPSTSHNRPPTSQQPQSLRIDTSYGKRRPVSFDSLGNSKLEIRPDCDPANTQPQSSSHMFTASPTADPTQFYTLNLASTVSTKLGATLFPVDYASPAPRVPFPAPERAAATITEVIDPVDKAMALLVHELGFDETRARRALAMCDTGSGIDLQKAIELLEIDSKDSSQKFCSPVELPTPVQMTSSSASPKKQLQQLQKQQSKTYCDGQCKRTSTGTGSILHSRSQSAGAITDNISISPVSISVSGNDENELQDKISPLASVPGSPMSAARPRSTMTHRGLSNKSGSRSWRVLGMENMLRRKNSVLGIDEYQAKVERRRSMRAGIAGMGMGMGNNTNNEQKDTRVKDGLSRNLLGLGLAIGSATASKAAEGQIREQEDRRRDKTGGTISMPR